MNFKELKEQFVNGLKEISFKDPMVLLLTGLLAFIVLGSVAGKFIPSTPAKPSESGNAPVKPINNGGGIFKKTVKIEVDAAFGGDQLGYEGIVKEADVTKSVASYLVKQLEKDEHFEVVVSHEEGTAASVKTRAEKINKDKPAMVVSLRADGHPNASVSGMKVYADIPSDPTHDDSLRLAKEIATQFTEEKWTPETGYLYYSPLADGSYEIKFAASDDTADYQLETWDLMTLSDKPVVIVDLFKVTNEADVGKWANEVGYAQAAAKLYQAICISYGYEPLEMELPKPEETAAPEENGEEGSTNE